MVIILKAFATTSPFSMLTHFCRKGKRKLINIWHLFFLRHNFFHCLVLHHTNVRVVSLRGAIAFTGTLTLNDIFRQKLVISIKIMVQFAMNDAVRETICAVLSNQLFGAVGNFVTE